MDCDHRGVEGKRLSRNSDLSAESFILPEDYWKNLTWIKFIDLVYSEDDVVVPIRHMDYYRKDLPWAEIHQVSGLDHPFRQEDIIPDIRKM